LWQYSRGIIRLWFTLAGVEVSVDTGKTVCVPSDNGIADSGLGDFPL